MAVGEPFNANLHEKLVGPEAEALAATAGQAPGTVGVTLRQGHRIKTDIVRKALVVVAGAKAQTPEATPVVAEASDPADEKAE